jgi:hypothetical protein
MALSSVTVDSNNSVSTAPAGKLLRLFDGYTNGPFRGPFTLIRDGGDSGNGRHLTVRGREDAREYTIIGSDFFDDEKDPAKITGWEVELFGDDDDIDDSVQATKIVDRLLNEESGLACFRAYFEQADSLVEGYFLKGPGLEPQYGKRKVPGMALYAFRVQGGIDDVDLDNLPDGPVELDAAEFKKDTGTSPEDAAVWIKQQKGSDYHGKDLSDD